MNGNHKDLFGEWPGIFRVRKAHQACSLDNALELFHVHRKHKELPLDSGPVTVCGKHRNFFFLEDSYAGSL